MQPELFQGHLASTFGLSLIFPSLFFFNLYGSLCPTMLEFDFRAHGPTMSEIVTHIDHYVRQVELPETVIVLVEVGIGVTLVIVAVEHSAHNSLAIAAHSETAMKVLNAFGALLKRSTASLQRIERPLILCITLFTACQSQCYGKQIKHPFTHNC